MKSSILHCHSWGDDCKLESHMRKSVEYLRPDVTARLAPAHRNASSVADASAYLLHRQERPGSVVSAETAIYHVRCTHMHDRSAQVTAGQATRSQVDAHLFAGNSLLDEHPIHQDKTTAVLYYHQTG
jgi:hypothetical protein